MIVVEKDKNLGRSVWFRPARQCNVGQNHREGWHIGRSFGENAGEERAIMKKKEEVAIESIGSSRSKDPLVSMETLFSSAKER